MDSRIREIEQWITEAKQDLGESGREAYINKLYLLDAEIRAIIKEDGSHPAACSPGQPVKHVRRLSLPATAVAAAVGVLLLTASTAYLIPQYLPKSVLQPQPQPVVRQAAAVPPPTTATLVAYIPSRIPGEEILPEGWSPPAAEKSVPEEASGMPAAGLANETAPVILANNSQTGSSASPRPAAVAPSGAVVPVNHDDDNLLTSTACEAVEIALAPPPADRPAAGPPPESNIGGSQASFGSGVEHTVATSIPTEKYGYFPEEGEAPDPNDESVDNGDNSEDTAEEAINPLDAAVLELDETEIAERLKKKLEEPKDS
ncbi:hypothetical protein JW859_07495 [bacterium]|nr:hypothetical protein [bacterium]